MRPTEINFTDEEDEALSKMEEVTGGKNDREFCVWATDKFAYVLEPIKVKLTKKGQFEYKAGIYKLGRGMCRRVNTFTAKPLLEPSPARLVEYVKAWLTETTNGDLQWQKPTTK